MDTEFDFSTFVKYFIITSLVIPLWMIPAIGLIFQIMFTLWMIDKMREDEEKERAQEEEAN